MLLKDKTALITGGSRGIGKAIVLKFAQEGCNIAFTDLSYGDVAIALEKELSVFGVKVKGYKSDASDYQSSEDTVNQVLEDFGTIDILVNNAGITKDALLMRMTEEQWDAVINVNLKSVFNLTKACLKPMMSNRSGSIVNMSSVVGIKGNAGQANYSASKAGIIGFTKSMAKEVGARNVRCNAIAPGFILTDMTDAIPEKEKQAWEAKIPMKRGGQPEEVANVALFLASSLSSYVTGEVIKVSGAV